MSSHLPVVSVIMAINSDSDYVNDAIWSILNQTFKDLEFIIIANNCSDQLFEKIRSYKDSRIKLYRTHLGQLTFNLNYGLNLACGMYIARMDADDISMPDRIEKQVNFLNKNSSVSVIGSYYKLIDSTDTILNEVKVEIDPYDIKKSIHTQSNIAHPSVMARKSDLLAMGGYHFSNFAEDYDLWIRMHEKGYLFSNIPNYLLEYRIHENQSTNNRQILRNFACLASIKLRAAIEYKKTIYLIGIGYDVLILIKKLLKQKFL